MNEFKLVLMLGDEPVATLEAVEEFMFQKETREDVTHWIGEQMEKAALQKKRLEKLLVTRAQEKLRDAIGKALLAETIHGRGYYVTVAVDGTVEVTTRMPYFGEWYTSDGIKHGENPKGGAA
jgi:hypothetical protein